MLQEAVKDRPFDEPKAVILGITIGTLPIGVMGHDKPGKKVTVISHNEKAKAESIALQKEISEKNEALAKVNLRILELTLAKAGATKFAGTVFRVEKRGEK